MNIKKTILIVTIGRTGSTLLQTILNKTIPDCCIRGENHNFFYNLFLINKSLKITNKQTNRHRHRGLESPWYNNMELDSCMGLLNSMSDKFLNYSDNVRVGGFKEIRYHVLAIKSNILGEYLNFLEHFFPNCKIIFLKRNVSDVVNSWSRGFSQSEGIGRNRTRNLIIKFYKEIHSLCGPNRYYINYLDMINKNDGFKKMFDFIEEDYKPSKIEEVLKVKLNH